MFMNINTQYHKTHVKSMRPFRLFVTITIAKNMNLNRCYEFVSLLLGKFNRMVFHRNYKQLNKFLEGVLFAENHYLGTSKNDYHFHMLVQDNPRYDDFTFEQLKDIFKKAASKASGDDNVFNAKGINIQLVHDDGAIEYCFKDINDKNINRIKFINKDGLSDSLA